MEFVLFILILLLIAVILLGLPVAITLGGISVIFGLVFVPDFLDLLPLRIMGIMQNYVLIAVPLFVFMGLILEKSGLAESLLVMMSHVMGNIRGGIGVSVIIVGSLLAASTGIVGATVITMGLISLPLMLKKGYSPSFASGIIVSSGTLGQIIPPSIVLVLLGSVLQVSVGDLFRAAIFPGLLLVVLYMGYILVKSYIFSKNQPIIEESNGVMMASIDAVTLLKILIIPLLLIILVLGSIFAGIASPTEAAAVGAFGAIILALINGKLTFSTIQQTCIETTHLTSMVFLILLGATTFSLVFRGLGGDNYFIEMIRSSELDKHTFIIMVMLIVFIAGFFIDFIEIIFIIVPVVTPVFVELDIDLIWIGLLIAMNLQTSFLTPPFGFALFYLKGVAPDEVNTSDIYRGVVPFLCIQILVLILLFFIPDLLYII